MSGQMSTPPKNKPRNTPEGKDFRKRLKTFKKTIGGNIERIRKAQDVPLRTLARKTGFSAVKLDYWEMGRMNIDLIAIISIARALKVPHEHLLVGPANEEEVAPGAALETAPAAATPETGETEPQKGDTSEGINDILLLRLLEEPEVRRVRDMLVRERQQSGYPEGDTVRAMEDPISDMFELSLLFSDLVSNVSGDVPFHRRGLAWLSSALQRDAGRLHRLYHGRPPRYG